MPVTVTLTVKLLVGETKQLSLKALDIQNRPTNVPAPVWAVVNPAIATIAPNDEECAVTGVAIGTTQITATSSGVTATVNIEVVATPVVAAPVDHLVITENNPLPPPAFMPG